MEKDEDEVVSALAVSVADCAPGSSRMGRSTDGSPTEYFEDAVPAAVPFLPADILISILISI